jgi:hypothetical protein
MVRMLAFLLAFSSLFIQGGPALTNQNGTITGVLRTVAGAPAVGVRVSALARPDAIQDLAAAASFAGLGETDSTGRYRLENIPPGRYYIVAGRADAPTYYPGTVQATEGTVVSITPGLTVSAIDFVLNAGSVGRANANLNIPSWVFPIQTRLEGGGKVPLFAAGRFPVVRLGGMEAPLSGPSVTLPMPVSSTISSSFSVRVTVANLPETYELRSLMFGATDLKASALQLPIGNTGSVVTQAIVVTLALRPAQPVGVRVSGWIGAASNRSIYISGNPGAIFSDGTFEFPGVPPGRHTIVSLDTSGAGRPLGAGITVGDKELASVELQEVFVVPADSDRPRAPQPAGNRLPGSRSAMAAIRGRIVDAETNEPFNAGKVVLNGNYSATVSLNEDGRFEVTKLLPGRYVVEAVVFGIGTVSREVILDEVDVALELSVGASR